MLNTSLDQKAKQNISIRVVPQVIPKESKTLRTSTASQRIESNHIQILEWHVNRSVDAIPFKF